MYMDGSLLVDLFVDKEGSFELLKDIIIRAVIYSLRYVWPLIYRLSRH